MNTRGLAYRPSPGRARWSLRAALVGGCAAFGLLVPGIASAACPLAQGCANLPAGTNLSGQDLRNASFTGTLKGVDFSSTNLTGATFNDAVLDGSNFSHANMTGAKLRNAKLIGVNIVGARLDYADLTGANLSRSHAEGVWMQHATVHDAELKYIDLTHAHLSHTDFSRSRLAVAYLNDARMHATILDHVQLWGAHALRAVITNASLKHANLATSNFHGADFSGTTLHASYAPSASFNQAKLHRTDFSNVNATGADFAHADFVDTVTTDMVARDAVLHPSNFNHSKTAVQGLYRFIGGQVEAFRGYGYGGVGACKQDYTEPPREADSDWQNSATCHGKVVQWDSLPFVNSSGGAWTWSGGPSARTVTLIFYGKHINLQAGNEPAQWLKGRADGNWAVFRVTDASAGFSTGPTGNRPLGEPGGPVRFELHRHDYLDHGSRIGYYLKYHGYLPRLSSGL